MYLVYILQSGNHSYIGMTNDFMRRWSQHNKFLKGGAKYTLKYDNWSPICIIDGFKNKSEAMQCEWKLKRVKGPKHRVMNLSKILKNEKQWTKNSPFISNQDLKVYVIDKYKYLFQNSYELFWF